MLTSVTLKNFGPLKDIQWNNLAPINVILGGNGQGKTFLLKALYASVKSVEQCGRGDDIRNISDIISDKIYWTFQPDKLGDLVRKPVEESLNFSMYADEWNLSFSFGPDTAKKITATSTFPSTEINSIFIPAKEVLSLQKVILKSREQDYMFGFDDTYFDLARAIRFSISRNNSEDFANSRKDLREISGGCLEYDNKKENWVFKKGNLNYSIGLTSEGIKKITSLETLLGSKYLSKGSKIFIDEPESALHPQAINKFIDAINLLSDSGIQFFIATHSYFVIKKIYIDLLNKNKNRNSSNKIHIPVLSLDEEKVSYNDMSIMMPKNSIIDESIRLYKEEIKASIE